MVAGAGAGAAGAGAAGAPRTRAPKAAPAPRAPKEDVPPNPLRVFVGNLPRDVTNEALSEHFAACGAISDVVKFRKGYVDIGVGGPLAWRQRFNDQLRV